MHKETLTIPRCMRLRHQLKRTITILTLIVRRGTHGKWVSVCIATLCNSAINVKNILDTC